jgi:hypothetical protein
MHKTTTRVSKQRRKHSRAFFVFLLSLLYSISFFFLSSSSSSFFHRTKTSSEGLDMNNNEEDFSSSSIISVAIVTTTTKLNTRQFRDWIKYHERIGVLFYYVFDDYDYDDADESKKNEREKRYLLGENKNIVYFNAKTDEALENERKRLKCNEEQWLMPWIERAKESCNAKLFVRQSQHVEIAISRAIRDNIEWIAHIDIDELLFPLDPRFPNTLDIREYLKLQPDLVDAVVFPNYEAVPEIKNGVKDSFTECTLFKKNYIHVSDKEKYRKFGGLIKRGNPNYFLTYANGKSIARINPKLRSNGAHRFKIRGGSPYWNEVTDRNACVLHYPYTKLADLSKNERCECHNTSSKCFILDFDREVYEKFYSPSLVSKVKETVIEKETREEFYNKRVVFPDRELTSKLEQIGLMQRITAPSALVRS